MGHEDEMSVMGSNIKHVDAAVAGGVLNRHKASGYVIRPLVEPNVGVPVGPLKTPPIPLFDLSEATNHFGGGGTTSSM